MPWEQRDCSKVLPGCVLFCFQRCKETPGAFVTELANIWRTILELSLIQHNHTQTFLSLPYVRLPKVTVSSFFPCGCQITYLMYI